MNKANVALLNRLESRINKPKLIMKSKKGTWFAIIAIIIIAIIAIWILSTPSTNQVIDVEGQDMIEGLSQD